MSRITKEITYRIDGFAVPFEPMEGFTPQVRKEGEHAVVAYAIQANVGNPLEDMDGEGSIYHHPRSRYGDADSHAMYLESLGLDRDGEPDLDAVRDDYVQQYIDFLRTADVSLLRAEGEDYSDDDLRAELIDEIQQQADADSDTDYIAHLLAWRVWGGSNYPAEVKDATLAVLAGSDFKTVEQVWADARAAGRIGNPYAVLLSCYEHGGVVWKIQGEGMNCRWDSSNAAAVWVPDDCAKDEIEARVQQELDSRGGEWDSLDQRDSAVLTILHNYARSCVEMYSNWAMGYVYYIVVVRYTTDEDDYFSAPEEGEIAATVYGYDGVNAAIEEAVKEDHEQ